MRGLLGLGVSLTGNVRLKTATNMACSKRAFLGGGIGNAHFSGFSLHAGKLRLTSIGARRRPARGSCRLLSCLNHVGLSTCSGCLLATSMHTSKSDGFGENGQ